MRILAIGAHPDDIEFGCGGTLFNYSQGGHEIYLLVMTAGECGGDKSIRRKEQERAAEILSAREVIWGGYRDTELTPHMNAMIHHIERVMKKVTPDLTLVNYYEDTHQDHRSLAKATASATRYARNVLFYEVPTTQRFSPTFFMDITSAMESKFAMLLAHESQVIKTNIEHLTIVDIAHSTAVFRGIQGWVKRAEGFVPLRYSLWTGIMT